jgi:hypothetical protein
MITVTGNITVFTGNITNQPSTNYSNWFIIPMVLAVWLLQLTCFITLLAALIPIVLEKSLNIIVFFVMLCFLYVGSTRDERKLL